MVPTKRKAGPMPSVNNAIAGPGQKPAIPPPETKDRGAKKQRSVDGGLGRQIEAAVEQWPWQQPRQPVADRGNDHATSQHEDETWIPSSGDVKEAANAMRVEHAGDRQAETEQTATNESGDGAQDNHATPPTRMR